MFDDRVELFKGWVKKIEPSPSTVHQSVSGNLLGMIGNYLINTSCPGFAAPFDVRLIGKINP